MEHGVRWHELEVLLGEKEKCEYVKRKCKELEAKWGWIRIGLRRVSLTLVNCLIKNSTVDQS